jgi:hypothetical protein
MVVVGAIAPRTRQAPAPTPARGGRKSRRSAINWLLIGLPLLLAATFGWQVLSGVMHSEVVVHEPVAVSRVSLEADPVGSRIDLVLVDRLGRDTTLTGDLTVKLREPDGTVWQASRSVTPRDFSILSEGALLHGRLGYSVTIPAADWLRAPRRGGAATVSVSVQRADGGTFSTVAEERFP